LHTAYSTTTDSEQFVSTFFKIILFSVSFRHEARDIFRNAVHASEHDVVIFAGHGCTGAVHKLIHALNLSEQPVVFVGPCEHHSNLLPWRENGAKVRVTQIVVLLHSIL
jgi:selenocysteine lyase/cysteine desulfurase